MRASAWAGATFRRFSPPERARRPRTTCASSARPGCASATATTPAGGRAQRLEHELGIINRMGFASYFLIVWDFVRFAREQGIPARPAARRAAPSSATCSSSATSARSSTTCCSSGSSTRIARRRPISTSTSARSGATRSSSTSAKKYGDGQRRPDRHLRHA